MYINNKQTFVTERKIAKEPEKQLLKETETFYERK